MHRIKPKYKKIVITISYGNYAVGKGGTDKVIKAHQDMFNDNEISVLHIYRVSSIGEKIILFRKDIWRVLIDGVDCGLYTTNEIINAIYRLQQESYHILNFFIHHLKNTDLHQLNSILSHIEGHVYFYLHDYFTICPSSGLIDEQGEFCGEDKPNKTKCKNCSLFNESTLACLDELKELFGKYKERFTFIAPSEISRDIWLKSYPEFNDRIIVIYHQKMIGKYIENKDVKSDDKPLNVAFVGYQRPLKGWNIWYDAVTKIHNDVNYNFYQFGTVTTHVDYIKEVEVDFTKSLDSMIIQLRNNKIDVAVLWSLWPETYSYTFYETMASNAYILTNNKSGNIAYQVTAYQNGDVANGIFDLKDLLLDEKGLRKKVKVFKTRSEFGPLELKENDKLLSLVDNKGDNLCKSAKCSLYEVIYVAICNLLSGIYKRIKA